MLRTASRRVKANPRRLFASCHTTAATGSSTTFLAKVIQLLNLSAFPKQPQSSNGFHTAITRVSRVKNAMKSRAKRLASRSPVPHRSMSPTADSATHCTTARGAATAERPPRPNASRYSSTLSAEPQGSIPFARPEKRNTAPSTMRHTCAAVLNRSFFSISFKSQDAFHLFRYPGEHALRRAHVPLLVTAVHHLQFALFGQAEINLPHAPLKKRAKLRVCRPRRPGTPGPRRGVVR